MSRKLNKVEGAMEKCLTCHSSIICKKNEYGLAWYDPVTNKKHYSYDKNTGKISCSPGIEPQSVIPKQSTNHISDHDRIIVLESKLMRVEDLLAGIEKE